MKLTDNQSKLLKFIIEKYLKNHKFISYNELDKIFNYNELESDLKELYSKYKLIDIVNGDSFIPSQDGYYFYINKKEDSKEIDSNLPLQDKILKYIVSTFIISPLPVSIKEINSEFKNVNPNDILLEVEKLAYQKFLIAYDDGYGVSLIGYEYYIKKFSKNLNLTNRQKLVLKSVIELYNITGEPVGSSSINELPNLVFSPATIRAEMALLEELEYLVKTHTSSGRVPSAKGYQYYIDNLITKNSEPLDSRELIDKIFDDSINHQEAVKESLDLLAKYLDCSFIIREKLNNSSNIVKKIELVQSTPYEYIIIVLLESGEIRAERVSVKDEFDLNYYTNFVAKIATIIDNNNSNLPSINIPYVDRRMKFLYERLFRLNNSDYESYSTGIINLLDNVEFMEGKRVREVYDFLEEKEVFNYVSFTDRASVLFGSETHNLLKKGTIISLPIIDTQNNLVGNLLCIGSERMNYNKVIPLLEYLSVIIGKRTK